MLKGQAKKIYQREYMRRRRADVRPTQLDPVRPGVLDPKLDPRFNPILRGLTKLPNCPDGRYREIDADGNPIYEE